MKMVLAYASALLFARVAIAYENDDMTNDESGPFIGLFLDKFTIHSPIAFFYSWNYFKLLISLILIFRFFLSYAYHSLLVNNEHYKPNNTIELIVKRESFIACAVSVVSLPVVFIVSLLIDSSADDQDSVLIIKRMLHVLMVVPGILSFYCLLRGIWGLRIYRRTEKMRISDRYVDIINSPNVSGNRTLTLVDAYYCIFVGFIFGGLFIIQFSNPTWVSSLIMCFAVIIPMHAAIDTCLSFRWSVVETITEKYTLLL